MSTEEEIQERVVRENREEFERLREGAKTGFTQAVHNRHTASGNPSVKFRKHYIVNWQTAIKRSKS